MGNYNSFLSLINNEYNRKLDDVKVLSALGIYIEDFGLTYDKKNNIPFFNSRKN